MSAGGYTDPAAEKLLGDVLIERRNKIGRAYLSRVNPLTRFALSDAWIADLRESSRPGGLRRCPQGRV